MAYSTDTLAQGCFGKVYRQKYNDSWAAIKKVPHQLINRKDLERECKVYNKAKHPNIVKLLGDITLKDGKWIIPLEFIFGEDLETTIFKASKSKIQLTPSIKGTIIIGMCEGLHHLHSKDIVHQDLKPENIMVEHNTNRAVIIDLGLAKFYRCGLSSALDMGNEAYSAPEVLQKGHQRHQSSDVWAMGKIIAELCARIRLYTPSVCPAKIMEILEGQPYCKAVCRMVEPNPSLRASTGGVISEIRRAGGAGIATDTSVERDHLRPPAPHVNARNRSPSPGNRAPSPFNRDQLPINRSPSPLKWERSPRPHFKALHPQAPQRHSPPVLRRTEDKDKNQALVPTGGANLREDFMKMQLYQEAAKGLPCNLPTTGRVVVRRFEEKNGEMGKWEQKEVVTRDGKIVKFEDVSFNSS
ncbi:putative spindle assembly checkpoint kinase-like [Scophthalmus maximus]|uniref:Putative spindle assembly checkpoint kinase-like n=1 Tax=Scophthalmus maximus TaxID=52904 RepID=A0A2U9AX73_SCOMX|nr:serine/threonine-protein kinase Nek8 [Scophthalmus maximus]XP_035499196.2 serine/threonine-protein kinase Nek8 [Scophthalmus maximus]XP_035499205.2 serine/threonine-protein kinase Nek8 [Scophthalmus maximus]XP_035499214.2 serine/threonine-protein kinase Nek8 [Scophthalmus maximus]XP_035499223.2 serine/threonine-protein kinase Nek8 [Scophthalmus maximus]XP_035499233.2 serine/threonine-protein kinase Nek8 [Scophthalmus maximus]XP_047191375.1 serine/threonine-protein kinase Nek8 [Scophthalmus